jgi:malate permease and related proteins
MENLCLLGCCLLAGVVLRRFRTVPPDAHQVLNQLLVNLFIPALTILHLSEARLDQRFLLPVLMPWLIFGAGWAFFSGLARWRPIDRKTLGALVLTGGISSVSFIGFPIFELLYGREGLALGIMMSQAGSFLVCVTLGVASASWYASETPSVGVMLRNIMSFPPFWAFVLALTLNLLGYHHPPLVRQVLDKLSSPFPIIALLSVGLQIDISVRSWLKEPLFFGLLYKLLLAPLFIFGLYRSVFHASGQVLVVCTLGAALGPMNTSAVIAARFGLNPTLSAQMVGVGIPLSLPVLYLIYNLI